MILARCPHCETVFRPSAEALGARHGKVRCGKCRKAFNALDHLIEQANDETASDVSAPGFQLVSPPGTTTDPLGYRAKFESVPSASEHAADLTSTKPPAELNTKPTTESNTEPDAEAPPAPSADADDTDALERPAAQSDESQPSPPSPPSASADTDTDASDSASDIAAPETNGDDAAPSDSSAEKFTADPLIDAPADDSSAARETRDIPGYDKWAEGTLSGSAPIFDEPQRTHWLSILLALLLGFALLIQLLYVFRTEFAARWPDARPWLEEACQNMGCAVPYPKDADLIDIQASELQADPARGGLLVLYLTLQNRSPYAQAYPSVELTLTDLQDQVVVRRVLAPTDWLPQALAGSPAFSGHGEVAARLWFDPKDTGAVGYRLKVIYP